MAPLAPLAPAPVDDRAEQVMVPMRDGVRLATDVYLPRGTGPFPVVLVRLPYDKSAPFAFMSSIAAYVAERGYALVAQDVRGKVRSEGETHAFVHEVADGYDTLEWLVEQSWCSGAVGMFGDSYYGYTQWAAAASGHPALRAIVPRNTTTHVGDDWMYHGGVFNLATMGEWAVHAWVDAGLYEPEHDWSVRPLARLVEAWSGGRSSRSLTEWRATTGPGDPYWARMTVAGAGPARCLRVPALHVGGWWDVFVRGQVADWRDARAAGAAEQRLVLDATDHYDDEVPGHDEAPFDPLADPERLEAFLPRYLDPALEHFDRHLRGVPGLPGPAVRYRVAHGGWREAERWPPPESQPLGRRLAEGGRATLGPEGGSLTPAEVRGRSAARWVHDPGDLVPSLVADAWRPLLESPDERDVEVRDDVLTFSSPAADAALDLAGPVTARLRMTTTGPSAHAVVKLVDVLPDGRTRRIAEGACLAGREGLVEVDLGHAGYRLLPGHRLRLELGSSSFPRYLPHPGTADDPWDPARTQATEQTIEVGGRTGSELELRALPANGRRWR